jgi:hypothetical protein
MGKPTKLRAVKSLLPCPKCKREMCLLGIESESDTRELYTLQCEECDVVEVRGVRVR